MPNPPSRGLSSIDKGTPSNSPMAELITSQKLMSQARRGSDGSVIIFVGGSFAIRPSEACQVLQRTTAATGDKQGEAGALSIQSVLGFVGLSIH
jgi:hypothetical protein